MAWMFRRAGLIAVNPQTLMTSAAGVFAGGDCVFGPRLIIDSVADGKRAAVGIDEFLRGTKAPGTRLSKWRCLSAIACRWTCSTWRGPRFPCCR